MTGNGLRFAVVLAVAVVAAPVRAEFPIKFAPPPNPMMNMTSTEITQVTSIDYMHVSMDNPDGPFSLNSFNFGFGRMEKAWENGGWSYGMGVPLIIGSQDTDGGGKMSIFGFGESFPVNVFIDPLSKDSDDNSMPIYAGLHFNFVDMIGSSSYSYTDYWGRRQTVYSTMMMMALMYGFQAGIQLGLNLGSALKFIPYVDFSMEMGGLTLVSVTSGGYSFSSSASLPSQPIVATPGFDLLLRPLNLSLGGAYQTVNEASGNKQKTLMLHLRFVKKFRSICGA
ncbi:MAG: hypothetical protein AAB152_10125 [Candidatus Coatesbacteria bacterium]